MQSANQDLNPHRQPVVLPFFGQLEVLSGKSRLKASGPAIVRARRSLAGK